MTVVSTSFSFQLQDMVVAVNTLCSLCLEYHQLQFETFMSSIRVFKDLNVFFLIVVLVAGVDYGWRDKATESPVVFFQKR